ncbi:MAG: hypothetical protein ACQEXX_01610 [Bacillota bacterium]
MTLKREYKLFSESWHFESNRRFNEYVDDVNIIIHSDDKVSEFFIRWHRLQNNIVPRLEAFDDSWSGLALCQDLIVEMGKHNEKDISPKAFCSLLDSLGFVDTTERERT